MAPARISAHRLRVSAFVEARHRRRNGEIARSACCCKCLPLAFVAAEPAGDARNNGTKAVVTSSPSSAVPGIAPRETRRRVVEKLAWPLRRAKIGSYARIHRAGFAPWPRSEAPWRRRRNEASSLCLSARAGERPWRRRRRWLGKRNSSVLLYARRPTERWPGAATATLNIAARKAAILFRLSCISANATKPAASRPAGRR